MILFRLETREFKALTALFLIFFVFYAAEITNFNITIDDETLASSPIHKYADLGRWVHPLIRATLWPQHVALWVPI